MELKKILFFLSIFFICSCSGSASGLDDSIAEMVRNDKEIEILYAKLQSIMDQSNGKKEFENDYYKFIDEECDSYEAKFDMINRQRNLYRCIHFYNNRTLEYLEIHFFKTDEIDVEINIYYSKDNDPGKCMIGKYNFETNSYIFERILYF